MAPRKPLPISLSEADDDIDVPEVRSDDAEERFQAIAEKLEIASEQAADAILEIIEDEDHKDRYSAAVMVLKQRGIFKDRVDHEEERGPVMASKDVLELVKEIGKMFVEHRDPVKNAKPVKKVEVEDV
jgi:hypothetical protein